MARVKEKLKLPLCLVKHYIMKTLACGGIVPRVTNLGTRWGWSGQLHTPAALPPRKELPVPIG